MALQFEPEVTTVLRFKHKVAPVLWVDWRLIGGGWMALPLFHFGMTTYDTGQLTN